MPEAVVRQAHHKSELLLQVANYLMPVRPAVLAARDVNPVIFTVGGFED